MNNQELLDIYRNMCLSRKFEERAEALYKEGRVTGSLHPYIGEEAIACTFMHLRKPGDLFTSTHRGVGHCVSCGTDPKIIMAELFGRATGICGGRGGSMHIFDQSHGNIGANGIVAGGTSLAVGAAMTQKIIKKNDNVVFCFFGEGASNEGVTHESMNLASVWKLPVVFVCENNLYEVFTSAKESCSVQDISLRAPGYSMPGESVDGNDVFAIAPAFERAIARARAGEGPSLVECRTYRWSGHWPLDVFSYGGYRSKEEVDAWKARCPIIRLGEALMASGAATREQLDEIQAEQSRIVDEAVAFADASPLPDEAGLLDNVFEEVK